MSRCSCSLPHNRTLLTPYPTTTATFVTFSFPEDCRAEALAAINSSSGPRTPGRTVPGSIRSLNPRPRFREKNACGRGKQSAAARCQPAPKGYKRLAGPTATKPTDMARPPVDTAATDSDSCLRPIGVVKCKRLTGACESHSTSLGSVRHLSVRHCAMARNDPSALLEHDHVFAQERVRSSKSHGATDSADPVPKRRNRRGKIAPGSAE